MAAAATAPSPVPQAPLEQQPATPTLPVVRTELVQLDVTVSDKDGRNVSGLTARDFVLLEDGRPQGLGGAARARAFFATTSTRDSSRWAVERAR
jgi:hypothetical protein